MRAGLLRLAAILLPLILVACGDLPTTARPVPDLSGAGPALSGDCTKQADGSYLCPPISSDPGDECDPYHYDCGEDDCIASTGPGDPEEATVQGCGPGSGGGDPTDPGEGGGGGGGGGGGTNPPEPQCPDWDPNCSYEELEPDTCVTNDPVINDPVVEAAFAQLWANSNPNAPQPERLEQAAWIVQTSYGLDIIPWTNADFGPCTISPHVGTFSIPTNAIAWIHTHPFTEGEVQTSCEPIGYDGNGQPIHGTYDKFPNQEDIELAGLINESLGRNIDAYTIDQANVVRFLATSTTTVASYSPYGRCGY